VQTSPKPECPKCGGSDTQCVSVDPVYSPDDMNRHKPVARILIFKCACGRGFSVKVNEPAAEPRESN